MTKQGMAHETPDTETPMSLAERVDDWCDAWAESRDTAHSLAGRDLMYEVMAELAVIRGMVEGAITECQLGSLVAAHFGRTLPDPDD